MTRFAGDPTAGTARDECAEKPSTLAIARASGLSMQSTGVQSVTAASHDTFSTAGIRLVILYSTDGRTVHWALNAIDLQL